jgi:hypothetical protein
MENISEEIQKELDKLKSKASQAFSELTKNGIQFDFTVQVGKSDAPTVKERFRDLAIIGDDHALPMIEVRSDINGDVTDVYVGFVSSEEVMFFNINTGDHMKGYTWHHIASLEDQLILLNEMWDYNF